jgi:monofunctional biosynthetic peptidoglycan transglycosylase
MRKPIAVIRPPRRRRGRKALILLLVLLAPLFAPVIYSYWKCPFMPYYRKFNPRQTAFMKYRAKQAKTAGRSFKLRYKPVPLKTIAYPMRRAVILAEDGHFYEHDGFDYESIRKAYEFNKRKGKVVRGASTISQQVAKNIWLYPKRSYWRKAVEAVLTWRLEHALPKDRILELYLNVIEFGPGIFGVNAAAEAYFKTTPAGLSYSQAALLTAAIPSPLRFNPGNPTGRIAYRQSRILAALQGRAPIPDDIKVIDEPPADTEPEAEPEAPGPEPEVKPAPPTPNPDDSAAAEEKELQSVLDQAGDPKTADEDF